MCLETNSRSPKVRKCSTVAACLTASTEGRGNDLEAILRLSSGAPPARRHLHQLLDLPLHAPGLVKMKMETACVDWPSASSGASGGPGTTADPVAAALPAAAAAPDDLSAVLGRLRMPLDSHRDSCNT